MTLLYNTVVGETVLIYTCVLLCCAFVDGFVAELFHSYEMN